jgi:PPOX class probable F420-dependent enzyme
MPLDADAARLAKSKNLATVVTLMPNGQPQAQLTWIDTDGENLLVNTEPGRQRSKNIRRDPRITLLLHSDSDAWDWAEVRGQVIETIDGQQARDHIDQLAQRYMGTDYSRPIGPDGRVILVIKPERVITPRTRGIR